MTPLQAHEVLTPATLKFIRHKARQLARRPGFTKSDGDDVAQELILQLVRALPRFDPKRGTLEAFVKTVVERYAATLVQHCQAECRDPEKHDSLNQLTTDESGHLRDLGDTLPEEARRHRLAITARPTDEQRDLVIDVAGVLDRLPTDLRDLAEHLRNKSISEIARETGIPRTTLNDARRRLREFFVEAGLDGYLSASDDD